MIVPMRKLSLLIFYKDYQQILGDLRDKGVVHIQENRKRSAEDQGLQARLMSVKRINEMIRKLENRGQKEATEKVDLQDQTLLEKFEEIYRRQDQIAQQLSSVQKEYDLLEPWGSFSWGKAEGLRKAGWDLRFYTVAERKFNPEWEEKYNAVVIRALNGYPAPVSSTRSDAYCRTASSASSETSLMIPISWKSSEA